MKLVAVALLATTAAARADGVVRGEIEVTRAKDVPVAPVLVYLVGFTEKAAAATVTIKQVGKHFTPDLVAVPAGGAVAFPNGDPFLHNVFSQTVERAFDLGSFPQGESRSRSFPKPGVIDVYCNLHPEMSATIVVLPNTKFAFTDAAGKFEIRGVPAGTWSVFAYTRRAVQPSTTKVTVSDGATAEVKLHLDEAARDFAHKNKFGETYRPTTTYSPGS